jgi:hypothetical protein
MESTMFLNLIKSVITDMAMEFAIERSLKVCSFFLLIVFELLTKTSIIEIKVSRKVVNNIIKMSLTKTHSSFNSLMYSLCPRAINVAEVPNLISPC